MTIYNVLIVLPSLFFVFATFISLVRWDYWLVRIFDFPRLQIAFLLFVSIVAGFIYYDYTLVWHYVITGALAVSLFYQLYKIYWYTIFASREVMSYKGKESSDSFSILVSNVYQPNRQSEKLIKLVEKYEPDLFLVLEADKWWEGQLQVIEKQYQYLIKKPQENLYGMILYAKLELKDEKINFLFENDIPSFEAMVKLKNGAEFKIYCLHPKPPFPAESDSSTNRDAELLVVGKEVQNLNLPVIIFGDFNDVAWSNTTRLFQKVSGLLDPRIGRGFFNSFHAKYLLLRWSLDHVFHSTHFQLIRLKRLNKMGSDHFPIYIKLYFEPEEKDLHEEPEADGEDMELADEKINKAQEEN